jgi:hypothetical protein
MNEDARERLRQRCQDLCTKCGVEVDYLSFIMNGDRVARIDVSYKNDINFELLEKLVNAFGTRKIDLGCDTGCSSDPCHERLLHIKDPVL